MAQFVGTVIGTKMDKTAKVLVTRMVLYRKLRKVRIKKKELYLKLPTTAENSTSESVFP